VDVDVDRKDIRLANGTRLTNEVAEEIVEQVRRSSGRPSLYPAREGKMISQLAREALEQRVAAS